MTTLLALYRRPEGGPEALEAFERDYSSEHLPLVAATPGLLELRVHRVAEGLGAETDLVVVAEMRFADRAALDAGLASDAMRQAGRSLRRIAPGLATLLVLEEAPDLTPADAPAVALADAPIVAPTDAADPAPADAADPAPEAGG